MHEAQMWEDNCFLTLTYDDEHLPASNSLQLPDFQKFMKRLRKKYGASIRYFHCGEYGTLNARPHYHAIIFNHDFEDKQLWKYQNDNPLYTSQSLTALWPYGFSSIGEVTFQSAAYVARYILKKVTGPSAEIHYEHFDPNTGEITQRTPEYTTMSRGGKHPVNGKNLGGIGKAWLDKYHSDVYPHDHVVLDGIKHKVPRYYDDTLEKYDADLARSLRLSRLTRAAAHRDNNTPERLAVRETVQLARLQQLKRNLD